jgi:hypothetical protein
MILPLRYNEPNRLALLGVDEVLFKSFPNSLHADPHYRVKLGIKRLVTTQDLRGNLVFLDAILRVRGVFANISEYSPQRHGVGEILTCQNPVQQVLMLGFHARELL